MLKFRGVIALVAASLLAACGHVDRPRGSAEQLLEEQGFDPLSRHRPPACSVGVHFVAHQPVVDHEPVRAVNCPADTQAPLDSRRVSWQLQAGINNFFDAISFSPPVTNLSCTGQGTRALVCTFSPPSDPANPTVHKYTLTIRSSSGQVWVLDPTMIN